MATISRLLKNIGLFCRMSSLLWGSFAKETYNFKEPTHIVIMIPEYLNQLVSNRLSRIDTIESVVYNKKVK